MRYQTKLLFVFGTMLALSLFAAGMAYWGVERSNHYFERSRFAHEQLEGYLRLSANTYRLFKQWGDAMLIGEDLLEGARQNLTRQIERDMNILRRSIQLEVAGLDDDARSREEKEELTRISEIRRQLITILYQFGEIERLSVEGRFEEARKKLADNLQESIDTRFRFLIDQAISDELSEVYVIDERAAQTHDTLVRASQIHMAVVSVFILGCLYFLLKRLRQPLSALLEGTRALSAGSFDHRISVSGRDEFAELSRSFNDMAEDLDSKRRSLEKIRNELEDEVARRTEELQAANSELERLDAVRRRFFADISHELRTPLTVIRGEGQITLRGEDKMPEDYKLSLSRIVEQSRHLSSLVDDLLFIARDGVGELRLKKEPVEIVALLEKVWQSCQVMAEEKKINLSFSAQATNVTYSGDEGRLRQLFLILIDNALCYSQIGRNVEVHAARDGERLEISVRDEGIGIAGDELSIVFERFGRGANAQEHHADGIGLGLPLAKSIAEAHGADIKITSALNEGTTVTLDFSPVTDWEMTT